MTFFLDTHALLWAVLEPDKLSRTARDMIGDERNQVIVSAASAWEIATKVRSGKLPQAVVFESRFVEVVVHLSGYQLRPITIEDALKAGRLRGPHRDPFDRMIAAQSLMDDVAVVSRDEKLDTFGVRRVW